MKLAFLFPLFISLAFTLQAQTLKGRVVDAATNETLEFVSVYLNTTTRGTTTNDKGEFALAMPSGTYDVIVSYLGYEPLVHRVQSDSLPPSILFKLTPKAHMLGVVEVQGKRDAQWYDNLEVFKENFLGRSWIAKGCKLLNPEVLTIDFDQPSGVMSVSARGPLLIENSLLGYKVEYLLTEFTYRTKEGYVTFEGYPRYEPMQGSKSKQRRWDKNRESAYRGSAMHFARALRQKKLEEEGFNLRRLYRLPNPNRPTDEEIAGARVHLRANGNTITISDSISDILKRARLPRFVEKLDINPVPYTQYLTLDRGKAHVAFEQFMQVVYTGEQEEPAYVSSTANFMNGSGMRKPTYQTSVFSLRADGVEVEASGIFLNPLDVLFEGYWGWEKVGDMLPLDYQLSP
ncbi:carboxypeptidase-like regulatory domain-containing protein [Pontibacter indicus]|uniref:CarboxypepD_reg-like domain-containing protein n=1 Tax=Pontibacter indicus TaxID=1317125 RepID=A0A1R3XGU7_9BACT|nr:carboxypeptidase-like regulatory domain-containing protein [Pontibacter indicus]SIT90560.1 CarboxypepD_reg-like domain-containing protein [Pontibacter indicus]